MTIPLSGNAAVAHRVLSPVESTQILSPVQSKKVSVKATPVGSNDRQTAPADFLTRNEKVQIHEKFDALPPVLRKALRGVELLRRETQSIERSAQLPAGLDRDVIREKLPPTTNEKLSVTPHLAEKIHPTHVPALLPTGGHVERRRVSSEGSGVARVSDHETISDTIRRHLRDNEPAHLAELSKEALRLVGGLSTIHPAFSSSIIQSQVDLGQAKGVQPLAFQTIPQTETVALTSNPGDNRPRLEEVESKPFTREPRGEEGIGPGPEGLNQVPPLSDVNRLRQALPTPSRPSLVRVPTVNILDLVL